MLMLGTKCPSITSTWTQSQPAVSIAAHFLAQLGEVSREDRRRDEQGAGHSRASKRASRTTQSRHGQREACAKPDPARRDLSPARIAGGRAAPGARHGGKSTIMAFCARHGGAALAIAMAGATTVGAVPVDIWSK